jgi:hypothetical protein
MTDLFAAALSPVVPPPPLRLRVPEHGVKSAAPPRTQGARRLARYARLDVVRCVVCRSAILAIDFASNIILACAKVLYNMALTPPSIMEYGSRGEIYFHSVFLASLTKYNSVWLSWKIKSTCKIVQHRSKESSRQLLLLQSGTHVCKEKESEVFLV